MTEISTWFIAKFYGANGKVRYVGEGAMMPYAEDEARRFNTKAEAKAAVEKIGAHHKASNPRVSVLPRKGIIAKPVFMIELGL